MFGCTAPSMWVLVCGEIGAQVSRKLGELKLLARRGRFKALVPAYAGLGAMFGRAAPSVWALMCGEVEAEVSRKLGVMKLLEARVKCPLGTRGAVLARDGFCVAWGEWPLTAEATRTHRLS